MITTMYYYNYYKPYLFKAKKNEAVKAEPNASQNGQLQTLEAKQNSSEKRLLLNKALNKDVVQYAQNVSYSLTALKDTAKYLGYDTEEFDKNIRKYGFEGTKDTVKADISDFVGVFNKAYNFYSDQGHSQRLLDFSIDIDNTVISNSGVLRDLGININEDRKVSFEAEAIEALSPEELKLRLEDAKEAFSSIYKQSSAMLTVPLSEHMTFKSFNYYYNYKYGGLVSDTFKIIESGMIIDKVV